MVLNDNGKSTGESRQKKRGQNELRIAELNERLCNEQNKLETAQAELQAIKVSSEAKVEVLEVRCKELEESYQSSVSEASAYVVIVDLLFDKLESSMRKCGALQNEIDNLRR